MTSKPPTFALRMATSLTICLIFSPNFWWFSWNWISIFGVVLSCLLIWGVSYKTRNIQKSRAKQDWELYLTAICVAFSLLSAMGLAAFPITKFSLSLLVLWLLWAFGVATVAGLVALRCNMEGVAQGEKFLRRVLWPLLAFGFALGFALYCNGTLDFHAARTYAVSIQGKRIDQGRNGRGPLLKVSFWHDKASSEEVRVSRTDWERAIIGKTARVKVKPGFLGAEWVEETRVN